MVEYNNIPLTMRLLKKSHTLEPLTSVEMQRKERNRSHNSRSNYSEDGSQESYPSGAQEEEDKANSAEAKAQKEGEDEG